MTNLMRKGYLRTELVELLHRRGFDISVERLRKYEEYGLFAPEKMDNKYRDYSEEVIRNIEKVLWMKMIGLSLRRIKEALNLEKQIFPSPYIIRNDTIEPVSPGMDLFRPATLRLDMTKKQEEGFHDLLSNMEKYKAICVEVAERIKKSIEILEASNKLTTGQINLIEELRKGGG